jgi:hypothetical protein
VAEPALAGAHGHSRIALGELDGVEALGDGALDVLVGHVFADADEALALLRRAVVRGGGHGSADSLPGHGADGLDPVRHVGRHEGSEVRVVLDPGARLREQGIRRLAASGHDEEVAVELAAVEFDGPEHAPAAARDDLANALAPQVVDAVDRHSGVTQSGGRLAARLFHGHHHGLLSGLDRPVADESADAVGEHDAHEVVAREDERLLDRPRRDDDVLGAVAIEDVARVDGDEPAFPDSERPAGRDDLDAIERLDESLVDEDDAATRFGMPGGGLAAGAPAAYHEHLGAPMLDVVAVLAPGVLVQVAEAGDVAEELLVEGPGPPRPDHRPVVEAHRSERAAHLVRDREGVVLERAPDVLLADARTFAHGLGADPDVRDAVDGHHAVRAAA